MQQEGRHDWSLLVDYMCGGSARGYAYTADWYGALREHYQVELPLQCMLFLPSTSFDIHPAVQ